MEAQTKRAFAVLFCCLTCIGLGQAIVFAILPPVARELGLSPLRVSLIFASSASFWVVMSPVWGRQSDALGRRRVILIGLIGFGVSMILLPAMIEIGFRGWLSLSLVYPLMIAARCIFGFFGSGTLPASQAYIADRTTPEERARGIALVTAAFGLGQSVGPAVGGLLSYLGVLAPFYFTAGAAMLSALSIWLFLPEERVTPRPQPSTRARMRFDDARIRPYLVIAAALQAVRSTTAITLAFFLQDSLSLTAEATVRYASLAFVALAVAGLFAQLVLVQRLPMSPVQMMRVGVALALASFLCFVLGDSMAVYVGALVLLGLGLGMTRPGNTAGGSLAVEAEEQGAVAGLLNSIGVVGNVVGPVAGTALYELGPIAPYAMNTVIMLATLLFVVSNRRLSRGYR